MKKQIFTLLIFCAFISRSLAQDHLLWMQQPAISPDGNWIAFEYKGNLFKVSSAGGAAVPLTINSAYNGYPVWSHDGKSIAFASDRNGNFDVFIMPSSGGAATRLTYNSSKDIPYDFSADNQTVYFGTRRYDVASSVRFPDDYYFTKLYKVPAKGGRSIMVNSAGTENVHFDKAGDKFIFQDRKGYENPYRKHHTSAVTRDIWIYDVKNNAYTKVSPFVGEDREPVWGEGDKFYYLSERNGNQNLYGSSEADINNITQLTHFDKDPVRNLSRADNGTFSFTQDGDIYTLKEGGQPQKVPITATADFNGDQVKNIPVMGQATEMAVSPEGKEVAFVYRGEIFVTSVDGSITKRITNTPYQERMIQFSPDGRSILYSVEDGKSWDIYKVSIANKNEPYFYASTTLNFEPVIATDKDEFQGVYSPDGKKIAYLEERNIIKVYDIASKTSTTLLPEGVNYSYADGDQYFTWSPDGKYLLAQSSEGHIFTTQVILFKTDGSGKRINLTQSGFNNGQPQWGMGGKMMYWFSDKNGMKNLSRGSQSDVFAMFFDQATWDKYQLSKDDITIKNEQEKRDSLEIKKKEAAAKKGKKDTAKVKAPDFVPNLDNLDNRTERLTISSTDIADAKLSPDGEKLYYLARYDKGYNLWVTQPRTNDTKMLAELKDPNGSLVMSNDGKSLFLLADGSIMKVGVDDGKVTPVQIKSNMDLDAAAERTYIFDHIYKQVQKKFFDPKLQGVDWKYYHDNYAKFLPSINNNYDFDVLLSEFLGELNASHTGSGYGPRFPDGDATASLGLLYDNSIGGNGLKVVDIIAGGPFDIDKTKLKKGDVIDKIDGTPITDDEDWAKLLNHKEGKYTQVNFHNPNTNEQFQETVKPINTGMEGNMLLYNRWIKKMEHLTDSLSNGQVGYVHVRGMDDPSYRVTFDRVLGRNIDKKALIVDTRFNGGGWLHDDLATFLSGKEYLTLRPQSNKTQGGESMNKWTRPSCVLMSEGNYSDAFIFPYVYKELNIGKLIGMPVAGTGTAVWWEDQIDNTLYFGIPMISTYGINQTEPTENHQLEPDIKISNDYVKELAGEDQQLETAVKEMLKQINN
ncbi:S41 family peptidase [uncultured Mucilaginibacter sp.]|uniref:S41 family peptidase n=1 Tax=uncultured Mucilaginibacter sp. TaxID=797541 RepID=UPI0025FB13A1|nr:S41 family peptidase [uncultured Mucilaginibacter sp.]